jgi:folate-binding protein YgfZ
MSDKLQDSQAALFALAQGVVALEGPDAAKFAQAQCMNDVATLPAGHWQWSGWLTPRGRVIALFALLKFDDARLWMVCPDADAEDLAARLGRFVFRSRLTIRARGDLAVAGAFRAPSRARNAAFAGDPDAGVELDLGAAGGARCLRIGHDAAPADAVALARWRRRDLEHGLPRLAPAQQEQWTPQMLSLDRLRAYSVKKGCYPGQEIVARTHFLGQAKRGLALLAADAPLEAGMGVQADGAPVGELACAAASEDGWCALAVASLDSLWAHDTALAADGVRVSLLPLRDGLARPADA